MDSSECQTTDATPPPLFGETPMALECKTCAVEGCGLPTSRPKNLCATHRLPCVVVQVSNIDRRFVITAWAAKHGNEEAVIFLSDWSLGDLFECRAGFEKRLRDRGFAEAASGTCRLPKNGKSILKALSCITKLPTSFAKRS